MIARSIPRTIWQTHESPEKLGPAAALVERWAALPGWEHRLVFAEERRAFIEAEFGTVFVRMYDALPLNVMRADLWRFCVLLRQGGLYADVDFEVLAPPDDWDVPEDCDCVLSWEHNPPPVKRIANSLMLAAPEHWVMAAAVCEIERRVVQGYGLGPNTPHLVTGPQMFTEAVLRVWDEQSQWFRGSGYSAVILPWEAFFGENAPTRHHFGAQRPEWEAAGYPSWKRELAECLK